MLAAIHSEKGLELVLDRLADDKFLKSLGVNAYYLVIDAFGDWGGDDVRHLLWFVTKDARTEMQLWAAIRSLLEVAKPDDVRELVAWFCELSSPIAWKGLLRRFAMSVDLTDLFGGIKGALADGVDQALGEAEEELSVLFL